MRLGARLHGFAMAEVLVTMALLAIGMLGMAGLQSKTSAMQMEAYQRAQALSLAQDMADRIAARKTLAANYVSNDYGTGDEQNCSSLTGYALDKCTWGNAMRGAAEKIGADRVGTLLGGRGCVVNPATNQYVVVVVWQGVVGTAAPSVACGRNLYGSETLRRAVVVPVRFADLNAS
jgi:type IV pilus assembly protein PilV